MAAGNGFEPLEGFEALTDFRGLHDKPDSDNQPKMAETTGIAPVRRFHDDGLATRSNNFSGKSPKWWV